MQINQFLENSAEQYPDKNAVWYKNEWTTFGQLEALSNKVANYLREIGISSGDRVALLFENSPAYIICYYAILKVNAVTVALNTETSVNSLIYLINDSGAKALLSQKKYSRIIVPAISKTPYLKHVIIDQDDLSPYEEIGHCSQTRLTDIFDNYSPEKGERRGIDIDVASLV